VCVLGALVSGWSVCEQFTNRQMYHIQIHIVIILWYDNIFCAHFLFSPDSECRRQQKLIAINNIACGLTQ
jgi:hypothetical protein